VIRFPVVGAIAVGALAVGAIAVGAIAGCASQPPGSAAYSAEPAARAVPAATSPTPKPKPKPKPIPKHVVIDSVRAPDGTLVTIAVFKGPVRYVLHDGSQDPYAPPGELRETYYIGAHERTELLAAFNGGFKMNAGAGGYRQEGHTLYPLQPGLASLVLAKDGTARMVVWPERGIPGAYSVRQNLRPLVLGGRPAGAAYEWGLWGATLGGGEYVARSAVGEDASGELIYAGSMSTTPYDLAYALSRAGARIGMELDINPEWVQLDAARRPGGPLRAEVPGQNRPADQFVLGWGRDFFTVLG
jgi:hypothetical protein